MGKYDFDKVTDRRGTGAVKYDGLRELFGDADLTPLWVADMDFEVCPAISDALHERFSHHVYGYPRTPDSFWPSVTGWLSRRHGLEVQPEELAFVPGVVRGIAYVLNFFTRPGDAVVIQPPVYHPFRILTEGNGRRVVENPLVEMPDGTYAMALEGLEKVFATEHPAMMILCNPHNPAGIQWDADTLRRVAELARRYGVKVISDEIHGDLMLYGCRHIPFCTVSDDAAAVSITFGAPSKTFNIPGLISSWMIVRNPEMRKAFYDWMAVNEFSAPPFTATVATEAAYRYGEEWLTELLEYLEGNIDAVVDFVEKNMPGVRAVRPQASFLVWLDFRGLGLSHDELVDRMLKKARLALNDGAMFGRQGSGFMRLNVAKPRAELLKDMSRMAQAFAE